MIGWTDAPADLSDRRALHRLSRFLPEVATVVSSDLSRARDTADAIQGSRRRLPHRPGLREINFGAWEGRSHADVSADDPDRAFAFWDSPGDVAPPGGESWNLFCDRICADTESLLKAAQGDLVIVAHFGVILSQLQLWLDLTPIEAFSHRIENLSVTRIDLDKTGKAHVPLINHVP